MVVIRSACWAHDEELEMMVHRDEVCWHNMLAMEEDEHATPCGDDGALALDAAWVRVVEEHAGGDHMCVLDEA